jgi:valyl-tRNA synthetase
MQQNKYNFFEIEEKTRNFWQEQSIYTFKPKEGSEIIVIDTPPPTISGKLHIGHIFSYTQQDIIARFLRFSGNQVLYPFGLDDNGLPTERYIEQKKGISSHSMTRTAFLEASLSEIKEAQNLYISLWKKLGFSVDWDFTYSTISKEVQAVSQKSFIELYEKGFIYKRYEPALFCTAYRTSVSQADLEEKEKETLINTIIFKESETGEAIKIATTRPELLGACVAVFIHPEDERYSSLIGKHAIVPIYNFEVPILGDSKVIKEKGTGIVMSCTFGDSLDIEWFKEHNLPYKKILNEDGTLTAISEFLTGMKVTEARATILEKLKINNFLISQEKIMHRVSIYERSKKEIEYLMLSQWFVSLLPFKKEFLEFGNSIRWFPEHMKYRYIDWVENLSWDWCISRQRSFGIPFPVWYTKEGNIVLADKEKLPVDPFSDLPVGYNKEDLTPERDVMDTWNTSSLTPYIIQAMLAKKGISIKLPLSIRPQAHDIIRTWAFDTIVKAFFHEHKIPWKDIIISGHVLSSDAQKISKSKENSPLDPDNLTKLYPADVIRYWSASAKLGTDIAFSETPFKDGNRLLIKLYNAAICIKNFAIFDIESLFEEILPQESVNKWILGKLIETIKSYVADFSIYEYNNALKKAEKFFWIFCDYYLEITKTYQTEKSEEEKQIFSDEEIKIREAQLETKIITGKVFLELLKLFAPFMPHFTEHLFQTYFLATEKQHKNFSLHSLLYDITFEKIDIKNNFDCIISLIEEVRKLKTSEKISLKTEIKELTIKTKNEKAIKTIQENIELIKKVNNINKITFCTHVEKQIGIVKIDTNYHLYIII